MTEEYFDEIEDKLIVNIIGTEYQLFNAIRSREDGFKLVREQSGYLTEQQKTRVMSAGKIETKVILKLQFKLAKLNKEYYENFLENDTGKGVQSRNTG